MSKIQMIKKQEYIEKNNKNIQQINETIIQNGFEIMSSEFETNLNNRIIKRKDLDTQWENLRKTINSNDNKLLEESVINFIKNNKQSEKQIQENSLLAYLRNFYTNTDNSFLINNIEKKVSNVTLSDVEINIIPNVNNLENEAIMEVNTISEFISQFISSSFGRNNFATQSRMTSMLYGCCFIGLNWDNNETLLLDINSVSLNNNLSLNMIKNEEIYVDELASDINTAKEIYIAKLVDREDLSLMWSKNEKEYKKNYKADVCKYIEDNLNELQRSGAENLKIWYNYTLYYSDTLFNEFWENKIEIATVYRKVFKDGRIQIRIRQYVGIFLVYEKFLDIKFFPIVGLYYNKVNNNFYGTSPALRCLSLQQKINFIDLILSYTTNVICHPTALINAKMIKNPSSMLDAFRFVGRAIALSVNSNERAEDAISYVKTPIELIQVLERSIMMIKEQIVEHFNITAAYEGNSSGSAKTGAANLNLQQAKQVDNLIINNDKSFIRELTNILIELIKKNKNLLGEKYFQIDPVTNLLTPKYVDLSYLKNVDNFNIEFLNNPIYEGEEEMLKSNLNAMLQQIQISQQVQSIDPLICIYSAHIKNKRFWINRYYELSAQEAINKSKIITSMIFQELQHSTNGGKTDAFGQPQINQPDTDAISNTFIGILMGNISLEQLQMIYQQFQQKWQSQKNNQLAMNQQNQMQQQQNPKQMYGANVAQQNGDNNE